LKKIIIVCLLCTTILHVHATTKLEDASLAGEHERRMREGEENDQ